MFQLPLLLLALSCCCCPPGDAEVLKDQFTNTPCSQFFFKGKEPKGIVPQRAARICQTFNNVPQFATMYDREKLIPLYSAYIYEGKGTAGRDAWMVEPQLVDLKYSKNMANEQKFVYEHKKEIETVKASQAINEDYNVPMNTTDPYDRGHLNPQSHHLDAKAAHSTFTLTNIVPQNAELNHKPWAAYEATVGGRSAGCAQTYVIVGVIPGNNYLLIDRVNIPSHIWAAGCCQLNNGRMRAWAVIAENSRTAAVEDRTVKQLEEKLKQHTGRGVTLFHDLCPGNMLIPSNLNDHYSLPGDGDELPIPALP